MNLLTTLSVGLQAKLSDFKVSVIEIECGELNTRSEYELNSSYIQAIERELIIGGHEFEPTFLNQMEIDAIIEEMFLTQAAMQTVIMDAIGKGHTNESELKEYMKSEVFMNAVKSYSEKFHSEFI